MPINPSSEAVGMFQRLMKLEDKAAQRHLDYQERQARDGMRRWVLDYLIANARGESSAEKTSL